jgi:hypothetical protein
MYQCGTGTVEEIQYLLSNIYLSYAYFTNIAQVKCKICKVCEEKSSKLLDKKCQYLFRIKSVVL